MIPGRSHLRHLTLTALTEFCLRASSAVTSLLVSCDGRNKDWLFNLRACLGRINRGDFLTSVVSIPLEGTFSTQANYAPGFCSAMTIHYLFFCSFVDKLVKRGLLSSLLWSVLCENDHDRLLCNVVFIFSVSGNAESHH